MRPRCSGGLNTRMIFGESTIDYSIELLYDILCGTLLVVIVVELFLL